MIELTEEPYDGPVAEGLVHALMHDLNERYAQIDAADRPAHQAAEDDAAYLAEVRPADVERPRGAFVVAWMDGVAVGCGAIKATEVPGQGEVKRMYTAPAARGRGVGRAVLAHLEQAAVELGFRSLRLETGTEQPEAIALYEGRGWHPIPSFGRYRGHPASVCLGKELPVR